MKHGVDDYRILQCTVVDRVQESLSRCSLSRFGIDRGRRYSASYAAKFLNIICNKHPLSERLELPYKGTLTDILRHLNE